MKEVVIIDAIRTPIGKYRGGLSGFTAVELGTKITKQLLHKTGVSTGDVDQVIFGNVLQAGNGQNVARQISIHSGMPFEVPAMTINEVCGSGLKSVLLGRQQILLGEADVVIAGGAESMSQAPMVLPYEAETKEYGQPISSMVNDGLTDAFSHKHMGLTAENVAEKYGVTREMQDRYALDSQLKAAKATELGVFTDEIHPIKRNETETISTDEGIRGNSTIEKLSTLKPAFMEGGTVTAGNASTLNDGAAAVMLASKEYADAHGLSYLAVIKEVAEIGMDPSLMGIAPIDAINKLIKRAGISLADVDLFEINEAFAASSLVVKQELNLPDEKVNIYGGGISLGHPIGATGARLLATLGYALAREKKKLGVASLCIGGGLGLAMLIERPETEAGDTKKKKFYELSPEKRRKQLVAEKVLNETEAEQLELQQALTEEIANHLIENQIGEVEIPLGVARNFKINGQTKIIPMATEEPSVIAAASNGAKFCGNILAETPQREMRGQIILTGQSEMQAVIDLLREKEPQIMKCAAESYPSIVARGGGVRSIGYRTFTGKETNYLSVDFSIDTKDAMGANIVNTILEGVSREIQTWVSGKEILFSILSNYASESLAIATCTIPIDTLAKDATSAWHVAQKIQEASEVAQLDPYRAATHNKGIMNGVEAVVLATGNDTRAVSAAIHAYASRTGQYQGLTEWVIEGESLVGRICLPLAIATVGGASRVLPKAKISLSMLAVDHAEELAQVIASVGLAQNFAALRALVTEGIQKGHMALQARTLAITVGATGEEIELVAGQLRRATRMNQDTARTLLNKLRTK